MKVSLVISTYNWPEALNLVLKSVLHQKQMPWEVIVADDGSGEETRNLINSWQTKFPTKLKHVWIPDEGFRRSKVLNQAYAEADGDYLIQCDGDSMIHPKFVLDHQKFAKPNTFLQGSRVFLLPETSKLAFEKEKVEFSWSHKGIVNRLNGMHIPWMQKLLDKPEFNISSTRGSNMSFWKKDLVAVNGYNEALEGWGREDSELAARLVHSGIKRRKLKFGGIQYHLYHKEEPRDRLTANDAILAEVLEKKIKRCTHGIDQYTKGS